MTNPVDLLRSLAGHDLSSTARLVAVLEAVGITDAKELQELTNSSERTIRRARSELAAVKNDRPEMADTAKNGRDNGQKWPEAARNDRPEMAASRARNESPTGIVINSDNSLSPPTPSQTKTEQASESEIVVNGTAIKGPWFRLDYAAIDMAAALVGMTPERARQIAEICARDWVANGIRPTNPMAMVRAAITSDKRQTEVHEVRLERAASKPSNAHPANVADYREAKRQKDREFFRSIGVLA